MGGVVWSDKAKLCNASVILTSKEHVVLNPEFQLHLVVTRFPPNFSKFQLLQKVTPAAMRSSGLHRT